MPLSIVMLNYWMVIWFNVGWWNIIIIFLLGCIWWICQILSNQKSTGKCAGNYVCITIENFWPFVCLVIRCGCCNQQAVATEPIGSLVVQLLESYVFYYPCATTSWNVWANIEKYSNHCKQISTKVNKCQSHLTSIQPILVKIHPTLATG